MNYKATEIIWSTLRNQTKTNLIKKLTFRKPDTAEGSPLQLSKGFKKDNNLEF